MQSSSHSNRGFVIVTMALAMLALCAVLGLSIDMGFFRFVKRDLQKAADAGAIDAAHAIAHKEAYEDAGRAGTARNGYTNGSKGVSVAVNNPPTLGIFAGNDGYVEVIVSKPTPTFFMNVLNYGSANIDARAVAYVDDSAGGCVYVLHPSKDGALTISGSGSLITDCGIYVDSDTSKAMKMSGSACASGSEIAIVGGFDDSSSCGATPTPVTGVVPQGDPLSDVPEPTPGDCTEHPETVSIGSSGMPALTPGTYCGGIKVSGSDTIAYFEPGEYILSGGLTVSGGASIEGTEVLFYNTQIAGASKAYTPFVVSGGSATHLTAPTTGDRKGMLFMQDRSIVNTKQNTFSGGSAGGLEGIIYLPYLPLVYSGGSAETAYTIIVASTLTISGPSYINSGYGGLEGGESPIRVGTLVD